MKKEKVNKWIATILGELYRHFPKRINLCPEEIDKNADLQTQIIIADLIKWLKEENIIRYENQDIQGCFEEVILTMKGFAILNTIPDPLKKKNNIGEFFSQAVKEASINTINQSITKLFQFLLKGDF